MRLIIKQLVLPIVGLYIGIFSCALNAQTIDAKYLNPASVSNGEYKYMRFGQSSAYYAGFMWNEGNASYGDGDDFSIFTYGNRDITLRPGLGNLIVFPTSGGNMGVGTTNPTKKLDVNGTIGAQEFMVVQTGSSYKVALNGQSNGYITGRNAAFENKFLITSSGNSYLNGGNLGIGSNAPESPLHLVSSYDAIQTYQTSDDQWLYTNWKASNGTRRAYMGLNSNLSEFRINVENGTGEIILNGGNVGVGTTTPDAKLAVNGDIHAKEVKVDLIGWPDYVFNNDYDLPSLDKVEKHIKEKGHLINIPSAKEVEENGVQLGEMNRLLLEKIEELTLYVIDLKKTQDKLIGENRELKKLIRKEH